MTADEPRTAVVSALVAKRAEIAGLIADLQRKIQGYQDDLVHLDHALRLFDPTISGWDIRAKRPKARPPFRLSWQMSSQTRERTVNAETTATDNARH